MSMFDKFKEIIGGSDYDEDFDDIEEVEEEEEVEEVEPIISKQRGNKVVNIHNSASAKVMVVKPNSYDEAREIAEAIKNRKIVVVNTTAMETKVAQRLVDFISGACCVLGAQLQEVEQRVYLLSPSNVEVSNELRLSYIPNINETNFYRILVSLNQPILEPFRRLQEKYFGNMMIDFAPVMAILVINLISGMLL